MTFRGMNVVYETPHLWRGVSSAPFPPKVRPPAEGMATFGG
jgi:hypothetical protein